MSLKKIAEMVGVSPSTVSRVLNDRSASCASEALKKKIWDAAHEINYIPNFAARNLKLGNQEAAQPLRIVVLLSRVDTLHSDPFFKELYRELEIDIFQNGFALTKTISSNETEKLKQAEYDGIIVLGRCSPKLLHTLTGYTRNLVGIWRNPMQYEIDEVVCDGQEAAHMAVYHLIQKGHQKIGYIGDCSYESRFIGYTEMMIQHHLPLDYSCIIPTDQSEAAGYDAMLRLKNDAELTAVLCANDISAVGALRALRDYKPSGHRKISVISIDNIEEAQATKPLLTTVHIPRRDMAHMAVQILQDRIQHGHTEKMRIEFPCRIAERDSVYSV